MPGDFVRRGGRGGDRSHAHRAAACAPRLPASTLLLSVDFEDWHQLVRRRAGDPGWSAPGPALARQTEATLSLLESLGARATFFVLGIAARAHPQLVRAIVDAGHEIACHGDQHLPVRSQSPEQFRADLAAAKATIEQLTARQPTGYRAPAFSIARSQADWVYRILAEEGFAYDASQCDSLVVRERILPAAPRPHLLEQTQIWEFPVAVWRVGRLALPVGGASYWSLIPRGLVRIGLAQVGGGAGLYLHPHELDPVALDPQLDGGVGALARARTRLRTARRNLARTRAADTLRWLSSESNLISYADAHAQLTAGLPARP
jgi:polysaccharide deacetylase family protein (PEP-CTERM system associated)